MFPGLLFLSYKEKLSHHRRPCLSHWGISSSESLRRCKRRPSGTLDHTASLLSPQLSPDPRAPLHTAAEAKPPEPACWTPDYLGYVLGRSDRFWDNHGSSPLVLLVSVSWLSLGLQSWIKSSGGCTTAEETLIQSLHLPALYTINLSVHQCWASLLLLPLSAHPSHV